MKKIILLLIFIGVYFLPLRAVPLFITGNIAAPGNNSLSLGDNFAALAGDNKFMLSSLYFNLFGMGLDYNEISVAGYLNKRTNYGIIYGIRRYKEDAVVENERFGVYENNLRLFYSKLFGAFKVGAAFDLFQNNLSLDGASAGQGYSPGLSAAAFYKYGKYSFSLLANRIIGTKIYYSDKETGRLERSIAAGIGRQVGHFYVGAGYNQEPFFSASLKLKFLSIYSDISFDLKTKLTDFAEGIGISLKNYMLKYSLSQSTGGFTQYAAISYKFWYRAKNIALDAEYIKTMYAELYNSFPSAGLGSIYIQNKSDSTMLINVRYRIKGLMPQWAEINSIIRPKFKKKIILKPHISDNIVLLNRKKRYKVNFVIKYQTDKSYVFRDNESLLVYPVAYATADMFDELSAYITFNDKRIRNFISNLIRRHNKIRTGIFVENKLQNAMLFYYIINQISLDKYNASDIQLPVVTLTLGHGDRRDIAVLYAALLEAAGIKTKLLFFKNDIVLLLDSGVPASEAGSFGNMEQSLIIIEGRSYIPISISHNTEDFISNWRSAAAFILSTNPIAVVDVENAIAIIPPVKSEVLTAEWSFPYNYLKTKILRDAPKLEKARLSFYEQGFFKLIKANPKNPNYYNQLAILYSKNRKFAKAIQYFKTAAALFPDYSAAYNNLGNVYTEQKKFDLAEQSYKAAIKMEPANAVFYRNIGFMYETQGKNKSARVNYDKAATLQPVKFGFLRNKIEK